MEEKRPAIWGFVIGLAIWTILLGLTHAWCIIQLSGRLRSVEHQLEGKVK